MAATNVCSNFGGKWDSPPFAASTVMIVMAVSTANVYRWNV